MSKKRKLDFVLSEDTNSKLVFRFYPRSSTCHSFGNEPPKDWDDVYKVYYYYKILKFYKNDGGNFETCEVLFDSHCDECSLIDEVATRLDYLSKGQYEVEVTHRDKSYTIKLLDTDIYTIAYCTWWKISEGLSGETYRFELFNYSDVGFRFWLEKDRAYDFGIYLKECCEYMLAHGNPI